MGLGDCWRRKQMAKSVQKFLVAVVLLLARQHILNEPPIALGSLKFFDRLSIGNVRGRAYHAAIHSNANVKRILLAFVFFSVSYRQGSSVIRRIGNVFLSA